MLIFKKYPSLENSDREKVIQYMKDTHLDAHEYVVQEKIHGSNLCLITDGQSVQTAKRSGVLSPDDIFYNHQAILTQYEHSALQAFEQVKALYPDTETLAIFGEIFGGAYPHAEVASVPGALRCQKHIYYSPANDFCAFDLFRNGSYFLDYDITEDIFKAAGFLYTPALARGDLATAMAYHPVFPTTLPERLGYPLIPNNWAEGTVIKPAFPSQWETDAYQFCLKQKNPAYREKIKGGATPVRAASKVVLGQALQDLINEGLAYLTEGRYGSVVSKIGPVTPADHRTVMGAYAQDLLTDFLKDHEVAYNALEKSEQKQWKQNLNKSIGKSVSVWLKENSEQT
jgi:Rnl2 family RNA ligase